MEVSTISQGLSAMENLLAAQPELEKQYTQYALIVPFMTEISQFDIGVAEDIVSLTKQEIVDYFSPGVTVLLNDGDAVTFRYDPEVDIHDVEGCINYYYQDDEEIVHSGRLLSVMVDDSFRVHTHSILPINGNANSVWSTTEIVTAMLDKMTTSDLFLKAIASARVGCFDASTFVATAADVINGITGDSKDVYNLIVTAASCKSIDGLYEVLARCWSNMRSYTITDNSIDFQSNDYHVSSTCGAVITDVLTSAANIVGIALASVGNLIGYVLVGASAIASGIKRLVTAIGSLGTTATQNLFADNRDFSDPLYQGQVDAVSYGLLPNYIKEIVTTYGFVKLIVPGLSFFIWPSDVEGIHNFEVYANLTCYQSVADMNNAVTTISHPTVTADVAAGTWTVHINDVAHLSMPIEGRANINTSGLSYPYTIMEDSEIRARCCQSIGMFKMLQFYDMPATSIEYDWSDPYSQFLVYFNTYTPEGTGQMGTTIPSWEAIVNYGITNTQSMATGLIYNVFAGLAHICGLSPTSTSVGRSAALPLLVTEGGFFSVPPKYTKSAVVGSLVVGAAIAAAAVGTYYLTRGLINRRIRKWQADTQRKCEEQLKLYQTSGDSDDYNKYYKTVWKYNTAALLLGKSTVGYANGWLDDSSKTSASARSAFTSLMSGSVNKTYSIEQVLKLINKQYN